MAGSTPAHVEPINEMKLIDLQAFMPYVARKDQQFYPKPTPKPAMA
jgi:hypothetical protein